MSGSTEQQVFISCSAESEQVASGLRDFLAERGWDCLVGQETGAAEKWQDAVADEIEGAEAVVLLVDSQPSEALRFEWSLALRASWQEEGKKVVPVLLLGAEAPPFLRNLPAVRLSDEMDEDGFERVLSLIGSEGEASPPDDDADEQARLMERLDQAVEALKRDSPNKSEIEKHRTELQGALASTPAPTKGLLFLSLGLLDAELGDHKSAREHLEGALREVEAAEQVDENRLLTVLMPLGDAQAEVEDYEAAIATFERVCAMQAERGPGSIGEAAALQKLGIALVQVNRPEQARAPLAQALTISREALGIRHPRVSALELWLALAAEGVGDYEAAKEIYEQSLASQEGADPAAAKNQVTRLIGLGNALGQLGELEGARRSFLRAFDLAAEGDVEGDPLIALHLALAEIERRRGSLAEARKLFERAIEVQQEAGGDPAGIVPSQLRLGLTLFEAQDFPAARKVLADAVVLGEETRGPADLMVIDALYLLGMVAKEEGDRDQAERRLRQAIDLQTQRDSSDERRLDEFRRVLDQVLESTAPAA